MRSPAMKWITLVGLVGWMMTVDGSDAAEPIGPEPTLSNVRYGEHPRHVLDFWQAKSNSPTPLVLVIHGGGWQGGDKDRASRFVNIAELLREGISVAAINYRLIANAKVDGVMPPVKAPLTDAARALQFIRSKAEAWNIDADRIGAAGGSAGACSSLWLAFRDDMADPESSDPIAKQSTRLACAAVLGAQTTLDPQQMKQWTPNSKYGAHAFGIVGSSGRTAFEQFLLDRERILPWIAEYSPYHLVTSDDPPVYLSYSAPPALGQEQRDPTHSSNFGVKLKEKCEQEGVDCQLVYPGADGIEHKSTTSFLIEFLKS